MTAIGARVPAGGVAVIGSLSEKTKSRLAKSVHGTFSKVSEAPVTHVVESAGEDLRALSERVNAVVGTEGVVAPLLRDDDGNRLFPTGRLQVQFKKPLSEDRLAAFAERHGLDPAQRNKWSPSLAQFGVRSDDTRYFPDVATDVQRDQEVKSAWPDVQAAFRREKR